MLCVLLLLHFGAFTHAFESILTAGDFHEKVARAINPTVSGQIGVNPVTVGVETTTFKPDDTVPTRPVIHDGVTTTMAAPFAVVTDADGDVVYPVNPDKKADLQSLFDEVASACAGKRLRKRVGECELNALSRPGAGGGLLEFDLPAITIPTITVGGVQIGVTRFSTAVIIAFIAYSVSQGKVDDNLAPKIPKSSPTTSSTSLSPTTTLEDIPDSLFTADPALYERMAKEILDRISHGDPNHLWSDDQTQIPSSAQCNKDKLLNLEASYLRDLAKDFCTNIDYTKENSKDTTKPKEAPNYSFNLKWEPKNGGKCDGVNCQALYNMFSTNCQSTSHSVYSSGKMDLDCGTASFAIDDGKTTHKDGCQSDADCVDQHCPTVKATCASYGEHPNPNIKMCQCLTIPP